MRSMKIILASFALSGAAMATAQAAPPAAAPATAAAQVKAGASVFDTSGAQAATIESVSGDLVVVSTGTNKVTMPMASFAAGPNGPVVSVTKAQLDAAAVQAAAQASAALKTALVTGAPVHGNGGMVLGTIKTVGDPNIVVATPKNGDVSVPLTLFSAGKAGVTINLNQTEFDAAATKASATVAK